VEGRAEVIVRDAGNAIAALARRDLVFEGVFLDPPYGKGFVEQVLEALAAHEIIAEGGWVSVETAQDEALPRSVGRLLLVREDSYGDTKLGLYELGEADEEDEVGDE
jgi:16S rRNA G966 N2-methylase RsmD